MILSHSIRLHDRQRPERPRSGTGPENDTVAALRADGAVVPAAPVYRPRRGASGTGIPGPRGPARGKSTYRISTTSGMVPLQAAGERALSGGAILLALLAPGVAAAVLWSPFLAARRLRALFRALPPLRSLAPNYLLLAVGGSLPYVLGTVAAVARNREGGGAAMSKGVLQVLVSVSLVYLVGVPLLAGWLLPEAGLDWDSAGYDAVTWALLILGTAWYVVLFAAPLFFLVFVFALPS